VDAGRENELYQHSRCNKANPESRTRANWKMTLNRNVENFFQKLNRSLFTQEILSGIDFLMTLFEEDFFLIPLSCTSAANFHEIQSQVFVQFNYQRGGLHRQSINKGRLHMNQYTANDIELRIDGDTAGFKSQSNQIGLSKSRNRHFSFDDHFSQPYFGTVRVF
jgi:catalase